MKKKLIACTLLIIMSSHLNAYGMQVNSCDNKKVPTVCSVDSNDDIMFSFIDPDDKEPK